MLTCTFCGGEILSERHAYRLVQGFESHRKQGGTNALKLRQPLDIWACMTCVNKQAAGQSPGQETLF